jgi:hypothetical protein
MDLGPAPVVLIQDIGACHTDVSADGRGDFVYPGAGSIVIGTDSGPGWLAWDATRFVSGDDLGYQPAMLA